jgi:hemoglobin
MRKQEDVPMATRDSPNLYERLGAVYSIATVVDDLVDRVMADPRLNANPLVDDARHKVPPAGFKYLVTEMLCWAAGGPQKYTGKDMESSHRHLRITPGEWGAFMGRSTSSPSRRPSGPRSGPSSRAPGARSSPPNKRRLAGSHAKINMERIGTVETICRYPVKRSTSLRKAHRSCNLTLRLRKPI